MEEGGDNLYNRTRRDAQHFKRDKYKIIPQTWLGITLAQGMITDLLQKLLFPGDHKILRWRKKAIFFFFPAGRN